ncbi:MAG: PaaX domain-containing protein, C- domain protein [Acidimicrobiales bacterium]|jgi:phenylacetic acid degradation operon negative regulatory protein
MSTSADLAPLTARSVLASTLLGAESAELPVAYLVHVASLFGINENRARVALSRMVQAGEAATDGGGGYRLAGHLLERQHRQSASRQGRTRRWRGDWHVVVVTTAGSSAEVRATRRRAFARARLAELREGTWTRPDNLELDLPADVGTDAVTFTGRVAQPVDEKEMARSLFDLGSWAKVAEELLSGLDALLPRGPDDLAAGFVLSAAVLRHLQADPLLPRQLLGRSWPGDRLRRDYDDWDRRYRDVLAEWSRGPA